MREMLCGPGLRHRHDKIVRAEHNAISRGVGASSHLVKRAVRPARPWLALTWGIGIPNGYWISIDLSRATISGGSLTRAIEYCSLGEVGNKSWPSVGHGTGAQEPGKTFPRHMELRNRAIDSMRRFLS